MRILIRCAAFALTILFTIGNCEIVHAQVSQEQSDQFRKLVNQLIAYRKLRYCEVASFDTERGLPKIDIKRGSTSANVALMKNIEEYIKNYSPKPESQATQDRFRHDMYLEITSSAESDVRKFMTSERKTNGCKEVLSKVGQHAD